MNTPDPGPGYELLNVGDVVDERCDYFNGDKWLNTTYQGMIGFYRRRIVQIQPNKCSEWRRIVDEKPHGERCLAFSSSPLMLAIRTPEQILNANRDHPTHSYWTHWQPWVAPDPEPSEAEAAYDKWNKGRTVVSATENLVKESWICGYQTAKMGK